MSGIYDILDNWDLTKTQINLSKYSKSDFRKFTDEIEEYYRYIQTNQTLGSVYCKIKVQRFARNLCRTQLHKKRLASPIIIPYCID